MYELASSCIVVMEKTLPKKSIRQLVYARVRLGLCIAHEGSPTKIDGPEWCTCTGVKRGRCEKHDGQVRRQTANLPDSEVAKIENRLVYEGQLLYRQDVRAIKNMNPVAEVVKAVRGKAG